MLFIKNIKELGKLNNIGPCLAAMTLKFGEAGAAPWAQAQ